MMHFLRVVKMSLTQILSFLRSHFLLHNCLQSYLTYIFYTVTTITLYIKNKKKCSHLKNIQKDMFLCSLLISCNLGLQRERT